LKGILKPFLAARENPEEIEMRTQRSRIQGVILVLALAVSLSACAGKSASSKFYVLSPLPQSKLSEAGAKTIGVFPVAMPDYLDRPQIVTRVSENEIKLDEFSRWAEPLQENFYTVLVDNLSTLLTSERIIKTAQNLGVPVPLQVGVEVVQFDGVLGGDVVLNVRWGLFETEGKKVVLSKRSLFKEPTSAATYEAFVAAGSRAVAALSREIAESIKTRK
jgi:uncharacterized protein